MRYAIALVLMLSVAGCENSPPPLADSPTPLDDIHAEFRTEIEKTLPADYSSVDTNEQLKEFHAIAKRVYGPHAAELRREATRLFSELPCLDSDALDGLVERFPDAREGWRLEIDTQEKTGSQGGILYLSKAWDPSAAALMAMKLSASRLLGLKEFGARVFHQQLLPDRVYRSGGTAAEPSIAIRSLQDIIIVKLKLHECGCYAPQEIRWYAGKK